MSIGKNIKQLRKQRNMTQKQLSAETGLAVITIQQYEAEKYNPKINALNKLCIALDCKITDLIDENCKKYYRMFDNEKVAEKIDYEHSHSFASSEEEYEALLKQHQMQDTEPSKEIPQSVDYDLNNNIHKYDASIQVSKPETIERIRIENKILNDKENVTEEEWKIITAYYNSGQLKDSYKRLSEVAQKALENLLRIKTACDKLNEYGQEKVAEHAEMIAKIPEYQKKLDETPQE